MKINFVLLAITLLTACNSNKAFKSSVDVKHLSYRITGIDSINSYYLIYATRDKLKFKIVSNKEASANGERIKSGKKYSLTLISMLSDKAIKDLDVLPENRSLVNCYYFDDSTEICYKKNYIRDLYKVENLKGLNIVK